MKAFSFSEWLSSGGSSSLSTYSQSSKAYSSNVWVYAAINRIATTASSAPLLFFQGDNKSIPTYDPKELITDKQHPVLKLFNPPKYPLILSLQELLQRTFLHLGIDGKVFWVIERKGSIPVSIDIRGKDALAPLYKNPATRKDIVGWMDQELNKPIKLQDVLLLQEYKPDLSGGVSLDGLPPLTPARSSLETEYQINGWNASFFKTGMKTPLLIQAKGQLSADQKTEIRKEIINYYSGIDGAHGALLLQGSITVTPLTVGTKDIDFYQGKKLAREEILAVYGVPPSLVGLFEYASYANTRDQITIFWEQTLIPKLSALLNLIQVNILDISFPGVYATWDLSKVAGLKPDPVALAAPAKTYIDLGYHPTQVAKILDCPALVPDKSFDKLRLERQKQQLQYQQQLMALSNQNQENTNNQQEQTNNVPKKGDVAYLLENKFQLFAMECMTITDTETVDELWDVIIMSYIEAVLKVLKGASYSNSSVLAAINYFKLIPAHQLVQSAPEIVKILVNGIYNSEKRN